MIAVLTTILICKRIEQKHSWLIVYLLFHRHKHIENSTTGMDVFYNAFRWIHFKIVFTSIYWTNLFLFEISKTLFNFFIGKKGILAYKIENIRCEFLSSHSHRKEAKPIPRDYDTLLAIVIKLPSYMSWFGDLQPGLIIKWPGLRVKFRTVSDNYDRYHGYKKRKQGKKKELLHTT